MATREEIELIRERADMVELASRYLRLSRSGRRYVAICPFHPDRRPSLVIDPERKLFHCFGCGEGGDIFRFLMRIEKLPFTEAVERLAQETGVELSRGPSSRLERLRELIERVARYYQRNLGSPAGARARRYLIVERGLHPETVERFRLGYALPGWANLLRTFGRARVEELLALGLVLRGSGEEGGSGASASPSASGGGRGRGGGEGEGKGEGVTPSPSTLSFYDRFRDRVIFPVCDPQGRVIGFAGRTLDGREGEPKYLNIPNTPLFTKGEALFGLHLAREQRPEELILVEGYFDVISAHQAGFTNTIGAMGTALTDHQARLIRRYVERVILAYDRDLAGQAATLRGMQALRNAGLEVEVALLPPGEDPDSLIRAGGAEAFHRVLEGAVPFHRFYLNCLVEKARGRERDPVVVERLLREAGEFILGLQSRPLRYELIRGLAEAFDLPEEEVELELRRGRDGSYRSRRLAPSSRARTRAASPEPGLGSGKLPPEGLWGPEEHLLYFLLQGELPLEQAVRELEVTDFVRYRGIIEEIFNQAAEGELELRPERLLERLSEEEARVVTALTLAQVEFRDEGKAIQDAIRRLKLPRLRRELDRLRERLRAAEERKDTREAKLLLAEQRRLQGELLELEGGRGRGYGLKLTDGR